MSNETPVCWYSGFIVTTVKPPSETHGQSRIRLLSVRLAVGSRASQIFDQ